MTNNTAYAEILRAIDEFKQLAFRREAKVAIYDNDIMFVSTELGDAIIVDVTDMSALFLIRNGIEAPFDIEEAESTFSIEYDVEMQIRYDKMIIVDKNGSVEVMPYSTKTVRSIKGMLQEYGGHG